MDLHTLNREFLKQDIIEGFSSAIWTERYYGDSSVELVVPATSDMIKKLPEGIFLSLDGSDEVMILETSDIQGGKLKLTGISILPWLNNRFIRTTAVHADRYWNISGMPPGEVLGKIVYNMCIAGSPYLDGTIPTGIPNQQQLAIPHLTLKDYDESGDDITIAVPFGPVYNALREIATAYQIGMQITLEVFTTDNSYELKFRSYKGLDRTSDQSVNPPVRFSPQMESLTDIKELRSIAALKTLAYAFAPGLADPVPTVPGVSTLTVQAEHTGFDLRASLIFADDITTDMIGGDLPTLINILTTRAHDSLMLNKYIKAVDGEIVPTSQFKYGIHYGLGDLIEVQGHTEIVQKCRVIEYIRAQDEAGERAYPTVEAID